jgi:uncharacterized membrane protein YqhA
VRKIFNIVFGLRYVAVLAIIAPFFGAVLMLLFGVQNTIEAYLLYFGIDEPEGAIEAGEMAMIKLVASLDHFLFAAILMIFGIGLYALFFRSSSKEHPQRAPSWNHLKNLGGMDEMLLKVIIMLLAVSFLEFTLTKGLGSLDWTALVIPAAIIALAIALRWMSTASKGAREEITVDEIQHHDRTKELQ